MIYVWTKFPAPKFSGDSLVSLVPGSCFKSTITQWKLAKNQNSPMASLIGPEWKDWGKKPEQKISWDYPFKTPVWGSWQLWIRLKIWVQGSCVYNYRTHQPPCSQTSFSMKIHFSFSKKSKIIEIFIKFSQHFANISNQKLYCTFYWKPNFFWYYKTFVHFRRKCHKNRDKNGIVEKRNLTFSWNPSLHFNYLEFIFLHLCSKVFFFI